MSSLPCQTNSESIFFPDVFGNQGVPTCSVLFSHVVISLSWFESLEILVSTAARHGLFWIISHSWSRVMPPLPPAKKTSATRIHRLAATSLDAVEHNWGSKWRDGTCRCRSLQVAACHTCHVTVSPEAASIWFSSVTQTGLILRAIPEPSRVVSRHSCISSRRELLVIAFVFLVVGTSPFVSAGSLFLLSTCATLCIMYWDILSSLSLVLGLQPGTLQIPIMPQ